MPTPFESAQLNLKLFELRRDSLLREARDWFLFEFNPQTFEEFTALAMGPKNSFFRMVIGYWDMASSLVTTGAIDPDAFRAAHGEIFGAYSKLHPFLAELRASRGESTICKHMEAVVMAAPDAEAILTRRRQMLRLAGERRQAAKAASQTNA